MTLRQKSHLGRGLVCTCFFLLSFLCVPFCSATVNKSTASVVVSTADQDNWYDLKDKTLPQTFAICDGTKYTDANYNFTTGCDKNGKHDDYLYTDTPDERNLYPVEKNFTIKASASASSGSMTKIMIEWIYGKNSVPSDTSWTAADTSADPWVKGSAACSNKGTCTFCVVGGKCDMPVIPAAALSVQEDGIQNRFHFRVSFSSSTGDTVTSGFDSTLSKFHSLIICGPKCHKCEDYAPTVTPASATAPKNMCSGLNDLNSYFVVNWTNSKMPSGAKQVGYKLSVRKVGTTSPVQTKEETTSNTYAKVPSAWLKYGSTYEWQVTVKFEGQGCSWTVTSPWSSGSVNMKVESRFPFPHVKVTNQDGVDCLVAGPDGKSVCKQGDKLTFDASGSSDFDLPPEGSSDDGYTYVSYSESCSASSSTYYSGPEGSYSSSSSASSSLSFSWSVGGASSNNVSFDYETSSSYSSSETGTVPDKYKYDVRLSVSDCLGRTCSLEIPLVVPPEPPKPDPVCPTWSAKFDSVNISKADKCWDNKDGKYYTLSWNAKAKPEGSSQRAYEVNVKDKSGKIVYTAKKDAIDSMVSIPGSALDYGTEYTAEVKALIKSADNKCQWEPMGIVSFKTPPRCPSADFTVKDGATDCFPADSKPVCQTGKTLRFDGTPSKVYVGSAKYDWTVKKDALNDKFNTGTFDKKYDKSGTYQVTLTVTDGDGNSSSKTRELNLKDPDCVDTPEVILGEAKIDGNLCEENPRYSLRWNVPAGYTQIRYQIYLIKDKVSKLIKDEASGATFYMVPSDQLGWSQKYDWQVIATLKKDKCEYSAPSKPSTGGAIKTPAKYPRPNIKITSGGKDCLATGECGEGDMLDFDGTSEISGSESKAKYIWKIGTITKNTKAFSLPLTGPSHAVTLTVTDEYKQTCSKNEMLDFAGTSSSHQTPAGWTEIAPR